MWLFGRKDRPSTYSIGLDMGQANFPMSQVLTTSIYLVTGGYHFYHINKATAYGSLCISPQS